MWGRAERQAEAGAEVLFARLGDPDERRAAAIATLERVVARLRAGDWSEALADLVARAAALDLDTEDGTSAVTGAPRARILEKDPA
jgi:hypothetical protein